MPVKLFGTLAQNLFKQIEIENGPVNMSLYLERYTFDAITTAGFGKYYSYYNVNMYKLIYPFEGYNANAIGDRESEWVRLFTNLKEGVFNPFFFFFPIFDTKLRWMFPSRVKVHQDLKVFLSKITEVIVEKRASFTNSGIMDSVNDNEKDLCTLMIEAEESEGGKLTNEQMMV